MGTWGFVAGGVVLAGVVGCGDTSSDPGRAPPPYFGAGSRLTPIVHESAGLELFGGWHDTLLDVPCSLTASDRCVPETEAQVAGWEFLDAACTLPAARVPKARCNPNAVPRFARGIARDCDGPPVYRIAPAPAAPITLFSNLQGECALATPSDSFDYYPTELVPNAELVTVHHVVRSGDGGIPVYALAGDDGSWLVEGAVDPDRGEPCAAPSAPGWTPGDRCLPVPNGAAFIFADSECTVLALPWDPATACDRPVPRVAVRATETTDECSRTTSYEVLELGDALDSVGYLQLGGGGTCAALGEAPVPHHPVTAPIPFDALPVLERIPFVNDKLSLPFHGQDGVPLRPVAGFVDRASGEACTPMRFSDETVRCVPANWPMLGAAPSPFSGFYSAADCSGPPLVEVGTRSCPAGAVPPGILIATPDCTQLIAEVRRAVSFAGPVYEVNAKNGNCDPVDRAYLDGIELYAPGELLAPDESFAPLVTRIRE